MTVDVDISYGDGPILAVPIPLSVVDYPVINGPAVLLGWSLREASGEISGSAEGSVTSPGALATIAVTPSLPAGTYTVNWDVSLAGTVAAGDANNFQLVDVSGVVVASVNLGAVGDYPQAQLQVTTSSAGTFSVQSIAAGTVGAIYGATLTVTPTLGIAAVIEFRDGNNPLGESSVQPNGTDTQLMFDDGVTVRSTIIMHVIKGAVIGVVYARYATGTG